VARQVALGILDGLLAFFVLFLIFLAYGSVNNPHYRVVVVTSGSMSPVFEAGDMIIATPPPAVLREGMIVVMGVGDERVTHRIVAVDAQGRATTQGDANDTPDAWTIDPHGGTSRVRVVGVYRGRIRYVGWAVDWLRRGLRPGATPVPADATSAEFRAQRTLVAPFSAGAWATPPAP